MADAQHSQEAVSGAALPFVRSVVAELTGLGPLGPPTHGRVEAAAKLVVELLLDCGRLEPDQAARALLVEPAFAASFFQNLDLLYEHSYSHSDAVSGVLLRVLELAAHAEGSTGSTSSSHAAPRIRGL